MPVNMDPKKRLKKPEAERPAASSPAASNHAGAKPKALDEETEEDREKELAAAEQKNLWDATEVIDMDKW